MTGTSCGAGMPKQRVAYLDPALSSGGDEAVFTVLEIGERREIDGTLIPTVYGKSQEVIPIVTGMRADPEWVKASERVRGQEGRIIVGETISPERQLAVACGVRCLVGHFLHAFRLRRLDAREGDGGFPVGDGRAADHRLLRRGSRKTCRCIRRSIGMGQRAGSR